MDTVTPESIVNEFDNEVKVMTLIAEKCGGVAQYDEEGNLYLYTFTPYELLRFADFLVSSTLDNYEEIQNSPEV
jgi:hypothetical protein